MSESHNRPEHHTNEHHNTQEHAGHKESSERLKEIGEELHKKAQSEKQTENIAEIQRQVEGLTRAEASSAQSENNDQGTKAFEGPIATAQLKNTKYEHTMSSIRKKLPAPDRAFSKVVHQPTVDAVSELGSRTIARPYALLLGGFLAFITSSFFLYFAKKYGWRYNFGIFVLSFASGYVLGLVIEFSLRLARTKSLHRSSL